MSFHIGREQFEAVFNLGPDPSVDGWDPDPGLLAGGIRIFLEGRSGPDLFIHNARYTTLVLLHYCTNLDGVDEDGEDEADKQAEQQASQGAHTF